MDGHFWVLLQVVFALRHGRRIGFVRVHFQHLQGKRLRLSGRSQPRFFPPRNTPACSGPESTTE
jgi:hypothetical protein